MHSTHAVSPDEEAGPAEAEAEAEAEEDEEAAGLAPEVDACAPDPPLVLAAPAAAEGACGPACWARHARSMLRSAASCDPSGKLV